MIRAYSDFPLKKLHTFGTEASTKYYFEFTETEDLPGFLAATNDWPNWQILILGEGSNLLFVTDFQGLIINPNIPGMTIQHEDRNNVWLEVGSGVVWDSLVEYAVFNCWGGIENLSLIPGKVGAAAGGIALNTLSETSATMLRMPSWHRTWSGCPNRSGPKFFRSSKTNEQNRVPHPAPTAQQNAPQCGAFVTNMQPVAQRRPTST